MPMFIPVRGSMGKEETLQCISDVPLRGAKDEPLCVAYKTSSYSILVPLYLKDDGYVLAVNPTQPVSLGVAAAKVYYPMPVGTELTSLQHAGQLPNPLPAYSVPLQDYLFGYLIWIALAAMVTASVFRHRVKQSRVGALARFAPSDGPLALRTDTDRWLAEEAGKVLSDGEVVEQQAYGLDHRDGNRATRALYVVVTNRRLFIIRSRLGGLAPKKENSGLKIYGKSDVSGVALDERHVRFLFQEGGMFDFFVEWSERYLSNQRRFLVEVPRLFDQPSAAQIAP